ncbi:TRAP transporter large permease subunit [Staphylococcus simiae]|uniref:CitMHS family transporter n=1 Tax=Staphylococcus simiae TaxID=308354 RepID=UPI001A96F2ED|nr:citrate:proton symporter [Staphylococcus simiae]MBO1199546.1 TRAP transporter large permease subunit [Staphylococcus simiae]MBO1201799.1 TRAP transporter large permease subunit [Staphylococcus simiae]MBO1203903.1 TRAP transporter large permease subunit [Staphylococcus simiae]MBO1211563.1 TRAP transporter large permease subunit [Staphylococcus simiae]MBO1230102.1 TRAP transporter large permease subunit [Staphylococcus simiae]
MHGDHLWLTIMGLIIIISIVGLLIAQKISPIVGMTLIPCLGAMILGYSVSDLVSFFSKGLDQVMSVVIMFIFAIIFFGIMTDSGLFKPLVKRLILMTRGNVIIVCVMTALIGTLAQLDGAGAVTFLLSIPALLPLYKALNMNKYLLILLLALSAAIMNMVPWGGPMARVATVLKAKSVNELWYGLIPIQIIGFVLVMLFAAYLGYREKQRIKKAIARGELSETQDIDIHKLVQIYERDQEIKFPVRGRAKYNPYIKWINVVLTLLVIIAMLVNIAPPEFAFMIGVSLALIINFKSVDEQMDRLKAHAPNALMMATVIIAAGMFLGVLNETGMLKSIATDFIKIIPAEVGPYIHVIVGLFGVPLDLLTSTDAYYFAVLPIVEQTASQFGVPAVSTAYAMVIGNIIGTFVSPFSPALWLAIGLAEANMGTYIKYAFFWIWGFAIVMLVIAMLMGVVAI